MDSKRKASRIFNNNPQVGSIRRRPNKIWWNCAQTDIKKERKKEEKEEGKEEEEEEEKKEKKKKNNNNNLK
jgi:hypothetical protein